MKKILTLTLIALALGPGAMVTNTAAASDASPVVLITGANRGLGLEFARQYSDAGWHVIGTARKPATATDLNETGARVMQLDVTDESAVEKALQQTLDALGGFDILFNNAGIEGRFAAVGDLTEDEWDAVIDINLKGAFLCMKYESRAMLDGGSGGAIVNVGSVNSFLGFPTGSAYVASKHALVGLTSSVSAELAASGIRVNLVCPGIVATPMHSRLREVLGDEMYNQFIAQRVHVKRKGRPEEIAKSIVFLCSDDASYITGSTLTPDGGLTMTL